MRRAQPAGYSGDKGVKTMKGGDSRGREEAESRLSKVEWVEKCGGEKNMQQVRRSREGGRKEAGSRNR